MSQTVKIDLQIHNTSYDRQILIESFKALRLQFMEKCYIKMRGREIFAEFALKEKGRSNYNLGIVSDGENEKLTLLFEGGKNSKNYLINSIMQTFALIKVKKELRQKGYYITNIEQIKENSNIIIKARKIA